MNHLISVIVPIYKVEKYLNRCIQSIVDQTYTNLEIILIDDGSPDKCPELCDAWEKKDARIRVIHKENGGLSDARNAGMQIAEGTYVGFVDSDDWIHPRMYERMLSALIKYDVDICECEFEKTEKDVDIVTPKKVKCGQVISKMQAMEMVIDQTVQPVVWNKLYKRTTIQDFPFVVGKYNEDEYWTYRVIDEIKSMIQIKEKLYFYFYREDSIINETYSIRRLDGLEARYERMKYLQKYPEICEKAKRNLIFECMYHYQKGLKYLEKNEFRKMQKTILEIIRQTKLSKSQKAKYSTKEKLWFYLSRISFHGTCIIRNKLKYGV